jgi:hypothetical protein
LAIAERDDFIGRKRLRIEIKIAEHRHLSRNNGPRVFVIEIAADTHHSDFFLLAAQIKSTNQPKGSRRGSKWIQKDGVELALFVLTFEPCFVV